MKWFKVIQSRHNNSWPVMPFINNIKGSFSTTLAIALSVIAVGTFTLIDATQMMQVRSSMQDSLDTALTAALKKGVDVKKQNPNDPALDALVQQEFENFFSTNFSNTINDAQYAITPGSYTLNYDSQNDIINAEISYRFSGMIPRAYLVMNRDIVVNGRSEMSTASTNVIIDIIMCIDATGSMQNTLDAVQANAKTFNNDLRRELGINNNNNDSYKIRVNPYFYRDFTDAVKMKDGGFIDLDPNNGTGLTKVGQNLALETFLSSEVANGGGDTPEAAGACLYNALQSNWMTESSPVAQTYFTDNGVGGAAIINIPVIVFWTDAPIASLTRTNNNFNPAIPVTYPAFENVWNDPARIRQDTKLLIQFGPGSAAGWNQVSAWDRYEYGGSLATGNSQSVKVIADLILENIPEFLRISS